MTPHTYIPTLPSTLGLNASFFLLIVLNSQSSAAGAGAGPSAPSPPLSLDDSRLANGRDELRELEQNEPGRFLGLTSARQRWVLRWVAAAGELGSEEKRVRKKGLQSLRSEAMGDGSQGFMGS